MAKQRLMTATLALLVIAVCQTAVTNSNAQIPNFKRSKGKSSLKSSLGGRNPLSAANVKDPVSVDAQFEVHNESRTGILSVTATIEKPWHINSVTQPKGGPLPTKISLGGTDVVSLVGGFSPDRKPHVIDDGTFSVPNEQHSGTVTWSTSVRFSEDADLEGASIPVKFYYQACADSCLQPRTIKTDATYSGELANAPVSDQKKVASDGRSDQAKPDSGRANSKNEPTEKVIAAKILPPSDTPDDIARMAKYYDAESEINYLPLDAIAGSENGNEKISGTQNTTTFLTALLGAFIGGFLLNLMPCVFPVLGIKVMGFVDQAGSSPLKIRLHGLAFTAGLVVSMWVLGGCILYIKSTSESVNWGQQMGSPYFVGGIIVLLFLMGLNLAGVFEFGTSMTRLGGAVQHREGYQGSFMSGVLTTLIATPCSGPFLGAAMGYTLAQETGVAMLLFTVLALGIALPYLVLSMFPSLINMLPRPGAWMETFKVTMAFLIFAAAAFFMRTFGAQTGVEGLTLLIMALVVLGLAAYFYGHWSQPHLAVKTRRMWGMALPVVIASIGVWMTYSAASTLNNSVDHGSFRPWTPGIVEYNTLQKKRPVLVDYTAEWCATCQVNEQRVFTDKAVQDKLAELGVVLVAADMTLTTESQAVAADLARTGRVTISTYLVYPASYPEEPAILLEELISPNDVLKALDWIDPNQRTGQQARNSPHSKSTAMR